MMDWWEAASDPRATWVRVLRGDPGMRWSAGEVGILITNTYPEKYDAMVLLPPVHSRPRTMEQQLVIDSMVNSPLVALFDNDERTYYFFQCDLLYERGPGYAPFVPGQQLFSCTDTCHESHALASIIAHDARAGL